MNSSACFSKSLNAIWLSVSFTISKLLTRLEQTAYGEHTAGFVVFTPEDASDGRPRGGRPVPLPGHCTEKASVAYAMRYADVDALLCAAAWAKNLHCSRPYKLYL